MTSIEVADRLLVLVNIGCVEEVVPLLAKHRENAAVANALTKVVTPKERTLLYYSSPFGSLMCRTLERGQFSLTPTGLVRRVVTARRRELGESSRR